MVDLVNGYMMKLRPGIPLLYLKHADIVFTCPKEKSKA